MADEIIFKLTVDLGDSNKQADAFKKKLSELKDDMEASFKGLNIDTGSIFSGLGGSLTSMLVNPFLGAFNMIKNAASSIFGAITEVIGNAIQVTTDFIKSSISTYMSFEDQLALVGKTTGMAGQELKAFGKEIIQLAKPIGNLTAEDLLKVAEAAGQLGIAKEDIAAFSVSIGVGTIALDKFGGSTEKLATSIAKQQNVFGDTAKTTDNYLSMLSKLSTSTEANELQISNFNLGMAKVASTMGVTAQESSALGAVLIAGGLDASSASRLLSSSLVDLSTKSKSVGAASLIMEQDLARGGEGFRKLEEITGRSRESFASTAEMIQTAFGANAVQSLLAVSGAFDKIPASAEKTGLAYDAVGKTGLAVLGLLGDAVNKPLSDLSSMEAVLNLTNEAFTSANEHMAAYDRAMATTSAQVKLFGSIMDSIKLVIGEVFVEAIGRLMVKVNDFMTVFSDWIAENETFKLVLNDVVAGLEAIANIALDAIIEAFKTFIGYVEENGVTVWDTVKAKVLELWDSFKEFASGALESIKDIWGSIKEISFEDVVNGITRVMSILDKIGGAIGPVIDAFTKVKNIIADAGTAIGTFAEQSGLVKRIEDAFNGLIKIVEGLLDLFDGRFIDGLKKIGDGVTDFIAIPFEALRDIITGVFDWAAGYIAGKMSEIGTKIKDALTFGGGGITKESNPELFAPLDIPLKKATEATEGLDEAMKGVEATQDSIGEKGIYNSVWPDTNEWVGKNVSTMGGLSSAIKQAEQTQASFGRNAVRSLNDMSTAYSHLEQNIKRYNPPTTIANAAYRPTETPQITRPTTGRETAGRETAERQSNTQGIAQPARTTINISGVASVDESSKERLARMISGLQSGLGSRSISAA